MLFTKKILGKRVVCHAARATIEQLERRRLLTSCPGTDLNGVFEIDGDNSVNNVITVY
jgi:hypothetical protein